MINFLRTIRKKLLGEKKLSAYLLYGIGEIVLVVIGILIALQVNNWNNQKKDREKEIYYLNSIKTSIALSQNELDRVISDAALISASADTLFQMLAHQKYELLQGELLDSLLFNAADYSMISLNDGGIREVLNTGALDIIHDEKIRVSLASWDEHIHKIRKFEEETQYHSRNYFKFLNDYMDFSLSVTKAPSLVIPSKKEDLLLNPSLRNYLGNIANIHSRMHWRYTQEKKALDTLNALIDQHLKK